MTGPDIVAAAVAAPANGGASPLLTGAIGVAGTVLGAAVSGVFGIRAERARQREAHELQQRRDAAEKAQLYQRASGAARHWRELFIRGAETCETLLKQGTWWPPGVGPHLFPEIPERREVASLLTSGEWNAVVGAEAATQLLLVARPGPDDALPRLSEANRELISDACSLMRQGEKALRRLAEA